MSVFSPRNPDASQRQGIWSAAIVLGVFALCAIRLVGFVHDNAVNLIFDDQWDFLNPLFHQQGPVASFLYQHGPPRMGLGSLIDWYVYTATDWDVRAVSWVALIILAAATSAGLALMIRIRGHVSWRDAGIPLLVLNPIHWESMTMTPSVAPMILPLFLTLLSAWAWTWKHRWGRIFGVAMSAVLNLFTGYGICAVPATLVLVGWVCVGRPQTDTTVGRRDAAYILIILALASAGFAMGYTWAPSVPGWRFPVSNWWDYPRFCSLMVANLLGLRLISALSVGVGGALLLGISAVFAQCARDVWKGRANAITLSLWTLAGTTLTYAILTAVGRLPVTIEAALMWRYVTLMVPGVLALAVYLEGKRRNGRSMRLDALSSAWVLLAAVIWFNFEPERQAGAVAKAKRAWIAGYLKTHDLSAANRESGFWVYFPEPNSPRIAERLRWLEQHHLSFFHQE